jgi:hypothetical protein
MHELSYPASAPRPKLNWKVVLIWGTTPLRGPYKGIYRETRCVTGQLDAKTAWRLFWAFRDNATRDTRIIRGPELWRGRTRVL